MVRRVAHHRCICSGQPVYCFSGVINDSPLNSKQYALNKNQGEYSKVVEPLNPQK